MFIELVCNDERLLSENIRMVKLNTPDYKGIDESEAFEDFQQRRENYQKSYCPLTNADGSYIVSEDCTKYVINGVSGYLPMKIVHFVMNLHTLPRTFYFSRHGQSIYNCQGKIGGDSGLTQNGVEYAKRLGVFAEHVVCRGKDELPSKADFEKLMVGASDGTIKSPEPTEQIAARLWTSTLLRTKQTAAYIKHPSVTAVSDDNVDYSWIQMRPLERRNLDELYAGTCDGMTYKEIEEVYPDEFEARQNDKLSYRYPRGESYMDVIARLEPLAHEMERSREPICIIGHQGILRIIYAYFMGLQREEAPYVSIPLNTVIKLSPHAYGCDEKRICLLSKEEMLKSGDGQDEPPTSMPVKMGKTTSADDLIMNAPSC
jgi:broad specificity phosphatase PhoE